MPIDLFITGTNVDSHIVVDNYAESQTYHVGGFGTIIDNIELDPDNWILKNVEYNVSTDEDNNLPHTLSLSPVYPNPFNSFASIWYSTSGKNSSTLQVYDITGKLVETLVNGVTKTGEHEVVWNASNYSSGVYFVQLQSGKYVETQKIILIK